MSKMCKFMIKSIILVSFFNSILIVEYSFHEMIIVIVLKKYQSFYLLYFVNSIRLHIRIACNHRRYFAIQIRLAETDHWFAQRLSISDFISDSQTWIGNVCKDYI